MLKNEDIICISSIDWDFIWQGHQEIMSTFAREGNRVLFIENTGVRAPGLRDLPRLIKRFKNYKKSVKGIRKHADNLYIYSPLVLPFPYLRIARWVNRQILLRTVKNWVGSMGFGAPVIFTFLPTPAALDLIENLNNRLVIYYCIDSFVVSSRQAKKVARYENKLLKTADLVFVTSNELHRHCGSANDNVYDFPFGVNIDNFKRARSSDFPIPEDIAGIRHPIIGYIGGIHKWIDQQLVGELAEQNPEYSFVFVGPLQTDVSKLKLKKNIYFLGYKETLKLPGYVKNFDVAIIPYEITEYTKNVYPTKLNEYLSLGKEVVSTELPEIVYFNKRYGGIVRVGRGREDFNRSLKEALSRTDPDLSKKRMKAAEENTWQIKIAQMSDIIEKTIQRKKEEGAARWKDYLQNFYRSSRRRVFPLVAALMGLYLLFFHTPFIWWLAEPLKIKDPPHKADVIVVLAGGVGESGKAGQGYEERVKYAVELYKEGYAPYIIFSSGYTYALREVDVMKALASSLGVPAKRIILEKEAANTYQNIKFSRHILETRDWDSMLLVTSPYHTLRCSLVCETEAPDIKIHYTPIPKSLFYGDQTIVEFKHIRAIFHEYLGILYYTAKGYIRL